MYNNYTLSKIIRTRMHSSRMRTGRSLTVCCSLFPGGCLLQGGGVPGRGGGGVCSGGVSAPEGGGVPGPGVGVSQHALMQTPPPPVDRILDTRLWKYYLGPTSLRPVKIRLYHLPSKHVITWLPEYVDVFVKLTNLIVSPENIWV